MTEAPFPDRVLAAAALRERVADALGPDDATWFVDVWTEGRWTLQRARGPSVRVRTPYQVLDLIEAEVFGRCMVLDGRIQVAESDEFLYHETLIHPALVLRDGIREAAVLGGGDGCAVRELARWAELDRITMVDLDEGVVRAVREAYPDWMGRADSDPRVEIRYEDGRRYLEQHPGGLDLVVGDLTEPFDDTGLAGSLSAPLFTAEFLGVIRDRLAPGGLFALQTAGMVCDAEHDRHHLDLVRLLGAAFSHVATAYVFVPSFGELWSVTFASSEPIEHPDPAEVDRRLATAGVEGLRFYDGETHRRLFSVPGHVRRGR